MKTLLKILALVLLTALGAAAQTPKTIISSEPFQDAMGNVVSNGTLILQLQNPAVITGTGGQVAPTYVYITLNSGGLIPSGTTMWASDQITPQTVYTMTLLNSHNTQVLGPEGWVIQGNSPIDLSLETPTSVGPSYPGVVGLQGSLIPNDCIVAASSSAIKDGGACPASILAANNNFTGTNSFSGSTSFPGGVTGNTTFSGNTTVGNLTITGTSIYSGSVSFTGTTTFKNLNNIKFASGFTGSDWCAKITAASTALAGPGEIWVDQSAGTSACASAPIIASNQTIRFIQPGTYHLSTGWTITNLINYGIIGSPGTTLQFDGSTGMVLFGTGVANFASGIIVDNIIFSGNSSVVNALSLTGIVRSVFINISARNCSGFAMLLKGSLLNTFINYRTSSNDAAFTSIPSGGVYLDEVTSPSIVSSNNNTFIGGELAGIAGPGVDVHNGGSNTWQNGASEGQSGVNGWGTIVENQTFNVGNRFINFDAESNAAGDHENAGMQTVYEGGNCSTGLTVTTTGTTQVFGNTCPIVANTGSIILYPTTSVSVAGNTGVAVLDTGIQTLTSKQLTNPTLTPIIVSSLPSASSNPYMMIAVSDSTTISAEGQTCVGSSTNKALAWSNGSSWKCF